ncbi:MAG: hypothetical protein BGO39_04165 [Chloroflexi bacterium 54-19]|nr:MAG: hypothetical protein BGO39_04165 [Chloroflexi bacterium 54-19]
MAVDAVMKWADPKTTSRDHLLAMVKAVALLVQPSGLSADKIGFIDEARFKTTSDIVLKFNSITKPSANAYTNDLMTAAAALKK